MTRAKDNVQIVSSIHYTDIDLSKSKAKGVSILRAFLDYAERGENALEQETSLPVVDHCDTAFELEVCEYLRSCGYTVDMQIGCSGYRIDMGLRRPNNSDYLMAIECDGANYHNSKNTRDRDCLRQRVLERMGWRFYRIWSTDWFRNKATEKERLLNAVKLAIAQSAEGEAEGNPQSVASASSEIQEVSAFTTEKRTEKLEFPKYVELDAMEILFQNQESLTNTVREILNTEAPLSEEYFLKRIVRYFSREKVTNVVIDDFDRSMKNCERAGIIRSGGFMYLKDGPAVQLRVPGDRREIKYIAIEELAEGMDTLIRHSVSVDKEGLYRTMTNLLGFSRTGEAIHERFEKALRVLVDKNLVTVEHGMITRKQQP